MRRLTRRGDRGVATIAVVLALPALLMMGSLVFDGARGLLAQRQTQNAADAAALATASACVTSGDTASTNLSNYATNGTAVTMVSGSCSTTTVTTQATKTVTPAFKVEGGPWTVKRKATATWDASGVISSTTVVPVVVAACAFSSTMLGTTNPIELYLSDPNPHTQCSSLPGEFGQADTTGSSNCNVTPTYNASLGTYEIGENPGADLHQDWQCFDPILKSSNNTVLIPLFDATNCTTSSGTIKCNGNGTYPIVGYAMFNLTGYQLQSQACWATSSGESCGNAPQPSVPCGKKTNNCLVGYFVKFVLPGDPGTVTGGPTTYGGQRVFLIPTPSM